MMAGKYTASELLRRSSVSLEEINISFLDAAGSSGRDMKKRNTLGG
jgi:hypothetical protein